MMLVERNDSAEVPSWPQMRTGFTYQLRFGHACVSRRRTCPPTNLATYASATIEVINHRPGEEVIEFVPQLNREGIPLVVIQRQLGMPTSG